MANPGAEKESFTMYTPISQHLRQDKSLLQVPKDPGEFVGRFLQAATPRRREEILDKVCSRREMVMDAVRRRREKSGRRRRRKTALSTKQKKRLDMSNVPTEQQKYDMYGPLHQLWLDYMRDTLHLRNPTMVPEHLHVKLLRCDLHGSILTVTKSKCPSYIGHAGIVIQESRNAFKIIAKADVLKTIPKAGTVFTIAIDSLVVTIYGNHLRYRAGDRANRKFKMKPTVDL